MTITERIFKLLDEKGHSQKKFCDETGIPPTTVSAWKARNTDPPAEKIPTIAYFFKVSLSFILTGKEEEETIFEDEIKLLKYFRELDESRKDIVISTACLEAKKIKEERSKVRKEQSEANAI